MKKTLATLVAAAPLVLSGPALAEPPELIGTAEPQEIMACGTTLLLEETVNRERIHKSGRFTGSLKIRLTNLENDASVVVNASGPGRFDEVVDEEAGTVTGTFRAQGRNLIYPLTPQEAELLTAAGLPQVFSASGPIEAVGVTALDGTPLSFEVTRRPARIVDLCAQLT